jgi:hypothetical protein
MNFLEGVVRHAAGLPPPPGIAVASARPLARFEPESIDAQLGPIAIIDVARDAIAGSPPRAERAHLGSPSPTRQERQGEPRTTAPRSDLESPRAVLRESESMAPRAVAPLPPHAAVRPRGAVTRGREDYEPRATDEDVERKAAAPPSERSPALVEERSPAAPSRIAATKSSSPPRGPTAPAPGEAMKQPTWTHAQTMARLERAVAREAARPQAPTELATIEPTVSVSIGRIEVEVAPPTAAPSRRKPARTRGFEAYARARRGQPR